MSETSLRRWTNAGLLPSFRVGGRSERRFRRQDLLAFLRAPVNAVRHRVPRHFCGFYSSEEGRTQRVAAFLREGLRAGRRCVVAATIEVWHSALLALEGEGVPVSGDSLMHFEYEVDPAAQLASWAGRLEHASAGDGPIHAIGDVSGGQLAASLTFEELLAYESDYEQLTRRFNATTVCLYDARTLTGTQTCRMLEQHGDTLNYPITA